MCATNESSITYWLARIRAGDPSAREEVLRRSQEQLRLLARRMLRNFPVVQRFEQTDDVLQNVLFSLDRALRELPLESTLDYLRLAATHIRRQLIDLYRRHRRSYAAHVTPLPGRGSAAPPAEVATESTEEFLPSFDWGEFHRRIEKLPEQEREIVELLWYHGLSQADAGNLLGVSVSTVKRRWQRARLRLAEALGGPPPC